MNELSSSAHLGLDPEVLQRLGRIDVIGKVIASALKQGLRRSLRHGFSTEFSDFKPYTPGDDLRFLDWRVYARTDRLLTRKYEAETSFESILLLDASKSMAWRWKDTICKLEYGINLFAALAFIHIEKQDQVGVLINDANQIHFVPPRSSRTQLNRIYEILADIEPGSAGTFSGLVRALVPLKRHRGQIIVCSDLEEDEREIEGALEQLAARDDEVVVLHLLDKAEIELPFDQSTHFEDSETGELMPIALADLKRHHQETIREFRQKWEGRAERWGIRYFGIHTGMSYVDVLLNLAV
jgi:uncharacterized protein (DUF58 family)